MAIVEYKAKVKRKVRGTNVAEGQTLYAVQHDGLYFIWSYSDKDFAQQMDWKLVNHRRDAADIAANWRKELTDLVPSDRKSFH